MEIFKIISSILNAKPQINADERRFVHLNRTRMTRIARIFTDPCASVSSAQSVFYCTLPGFICVHPRLIKSKFRQVVPHNLWEGLL
jgi:hypothetical protein